MPPVERREHEVRVTAGSGEALGEVTVSVAGPSRPKAAAVIAHGAGGSMKTPALEKLQAFLASSSVTAARFNFLYSERGKRAPDRQPALVDCWRSVADWVRQEIRPQKLFLGGRSMGGRMASYLVADGYPCDGIFFLAYPLHPPGKRGQERKEHLVRIAVPILFVSGTKDAFAHMDLLEAVVSGLGARLHRIEGADHGFRLPKSSGRTPAEIDEDVAKVVLNFIESIGG